MDAVVLGSTGKAILMDGNGFESISISAINDIIPGPASRLAHIIYDTTNVTFIEDVTIETIQLTLAREYDNVSALNLALISLDPDLSVNVRVDAINALEELLAEAATRQYIQFVFYSQPLPKASNISGLIQLSTEVKAENVHALFNDIFRNQDLIAHVVLAWESISVSIFEGEEYRKEFHATVIKEGIFYECVESLAQTEEADQFLLNAGLNPRIKSLKNYRAVLQDWVKPLRGTAVSHKDITSNKVEVDIEHWEGQARHKGRQAINREEVFKNVESMKKFIIQQMKHGNLKQVHRVTNQLVQYQLISGKALFAAKSLCDLAMEAEKLGLYSLQLQLTRWSIKLNSEDNLAWSQYADALLRLGKIDEASQAYDQAAIYGEDVVVKSGRAEVLKVQGKLSEALAAYEVVIDEYPDEVVAKSGRAEILKAQGRYNDALIAYEEIITEYPGSVVAKNGHAEVLKALGKLNDALTAYEAIIIEYPEDVFAKNGRAEVLKAQGKLSEALAAYETIIDEHPDDVVAKNGRAEVLRAQGKLNEALAAYEATITERPENVVAKNGRAEVLKTQGKLNEALAAYEATITERPENVFAKNGRAEVLKAQGKLDQALSAYEAVMTEHPENIVAKSGYACVLAAMGNYNKALECLPESDLATLQEWFGYHVRGMVLLRIGKITEATRILQRGVNDNPWILQRQYFQTALSVALMKQQKYDKASETLDLVGSPDLELPTNVLKLHCYGVLSESNRAAEAHLRITQSLQPIALELTEELERRYISGVESKHNDEWLINREIDLLLLAA